MSSAENATAEARSANLRRESEFATADRAMQHATTASMPRKLAFFAHDSGESTVIKRARAFQSCGVDVLGFMFHRERGKKRPAPEWTNTDLGETVDRNYAARLPKLLGALITTLKQRRELRQCDVIYARNIDMMAIAAVAKWLSGSSAQLVYEVLDVQRVFVGSGMVSAIFRWCERRLLAASDMLVVSSPMFIERYFSPRQNYTGKWYLLENKVAASQVARDEQAIERMPAGPPWVIGWFGTLRCRKSLDVLSRIASQYPDLVKVDIRGTPSEEDIPKEVLVAVTSGRPNFRYHGPYQSPRDLREIYGHIHFTWAIDFLDAGSNSDWLLPNRLYEGGLFDAISIARAGTATGDKVTADNLGVTLQEPILETLTAWLLAMNEERYDALLQSARRAPRALFVDEDDTKRLLQALTQMKTQAAAI